VIRYSFHPREIELNTIWSVASDAERIPIRGEFGGEYLPAGYGIDVGKLWHRRPVSL
jgi:hypothetical protein